MGATETVQFIPIGLIEGPSAAVTPEPEPAQQPAAAAACKSGSIEIVLPNGVRVSVDAFVSEKALSRILRAMKGAT
jgi:transposase